MTALSDEPKIISMAHALGAHDGGPVNGIRKYCDLKVRAIMNDAGHVASIHDLERLICEKLNISVVEIWTDDQLDELIEQHARREKDIAFAALRRHLDKETFATLIKRKRRTGENEDHYVAVVDCRGEKGARRFFTRWHEIAHVLTLFEQLQLPLHRSTVEKDPVERMMDLIAGDIGFFDPLFFPVLSSQVKSDGRLTFAGVECVRRRYSGEASFEATLNACASRVAEPVLVLHAAMKFKRSVERALNSGQFDLFSVEKPTPQLRVISAMANENARDAGLIVHPNMRVPLKSVIFSAFLNGAEFQSALVEENLNWWDTSDGKVLPARSVLVEAMKVRDQVWALLSLQ
jgi:hypothetical protein